MLGFNRLKDESSSDDDSRPVKQNSFSQPETLSNSSSICYKKTLRLSSEELVVFSSTRYSICFKL